MQPPQPLRSLAFSILFAAYAAAAGDAPKVNPDLLVSVDSLSKRLDDPETVILHIASATEGYAAGHIPGALFADWDDFVVTKNGVPNELPDPDEIEAWVRSLGIDDSSKIVLYDEEEGMSAARAFFTLDSVGLGDRTALLDGQLKAWKAAGKPLSTEPAKATPSTWKRGNPNNDRIALQDEIRKLLSEENSGVKPKFMDARSRDYFTGAKTSGLAKKGGRLPDAVQMDWVEAIQEGDLPLMKAPEDLGFLLEEKGVAPDDPLITYCNSGRSASHLYFTLRYLGYDVRLYDGSMSEWTFDDSNPIESGTPEAKAAPAKD